jgi:hypothetical protein
MDRKDVKGKLSAQTVKHVHRVLHVALETAVQWRVLPVHPLAGVKAPSVPWSGMKSFDVERGDCSARPLEDPLPIRCQ